MIEDCFGLFFPPQVCLYCMRNRKMIHLSPNVCVTPVTVITSELHLEKKREDILILKDSPK